MTTFALISFAIVYSIMSLNLLMRLVRGMITLTLAQTHSDDAKDMIEYFYSPVFGRRVIFFSLLWPVIEPLLFLGFNITKRKNK